MTEGRDSPEPFVIMMSFTDPRLLLSRRPRRASRICPKSGDCVGSPSPERAKSLRRAKEKGGGPPAPGGGGVGGGERGGGGGAPACLGGERSVRPVVKDGGRFGEDRANVYPRRGSRPPAIDLAIPAGEVHAQRNAARAPRKNGIDEPEPGVGARVERMAGPRLHPFEVLGLAGS